MTLLKLITMAAVSLFASVVLAQNLRPCTQEVLQCKLEDATDLYHRLPLDQARVSFSGLNNDEPSIPPEQCQILAALDNKKGRFYTVDLGDKTYMAHIFARTAENISALLPGDVSFFVVRGKPFYYTYGKDLLTCELK